MNPASVVESHSGRRNNNNNKTKNRMEDRTKVAAAAASVIPFSCIICFDEFDSQERPPMILPCGHTYVCLPCTKRLKRCMECRQSLFLPAPSAASAAAPHFPSHGTTAHYYHHNSQYNQYNLQHRALAQRYGTTLPDVGPPPLTPPHSTLHGSSSSSAAAAHQPIPLPIPKNLVLLSMMEAAERQARIKHQQQQQQQQLAAASEEVNDESDDSDNDDNEDDDDENEAFDLDKIITGMATLSGPCGTYAVREKGGLVVVRADPRRRRNDANTNNNNSNTDDDDDEDDDETALYGQPSQEINLKEEEKDDKKENIEFSQQDASTSVEEGERDEKKEEETADETVSVAAYTNDDADDDKQKEPQSPIPLEYGQTVQVVSFEDGVAKLARSKGYVLGNASQLVKVGGALDESCRLEGLLHTVLSRGEDLQKTLDDNRQIERGLQRQLEMAMTAEPSHPIISPLPRRHYEDDDQHDDHHPHPNNNNNNNYDTDDCKLPASSSHDPDDTHNPAPNQLLQTPQMAATAQLNTPERSVTEVYHTPQQRSVMDEDDHANGENTPATPRSPNSIDNSDIGIGPYMPHYRECDSQDDNNSAAGGGGRMVDFGCASVLLEEGAELFGENVVGSGIISGDRSVRSTGARDRRRSTTYSPTIDEQGASSNRTRSSSIEVLGQRSHMAASAATSGSHHHNHPAPTLTASFDNIDFRTGLSGHRALTTAHLHSSPKPNKRHIRMSEHRGLGR